ncbi:MAG: FadR/GntR family transcriptional regulator [Candidatus Dormibacteraceae bacterium]
MTLVVLQEEVKQLILDRRLQPGDPLPTESELMELLRVGRNSVRETLKSLQALDLVEIRHGYGTFVGSMSLQPLTDGLTFRIHTDPRDGLRGLRELLEIREELEAALIRKVTPLTGEDELRRLREALDAIDAAQRADSAARAFADQAFHQLLYQPLRNQLVLQLLDTFWIVYQRLGVDLRRQGLPDARALVEHHRAIVEALAGGDPSAAEQAVRAHFAEIEERLAWISPPADGMQG